MATATATATATVARASEAGAYRPKEDVWFDDGREEQLLAFVQSRLGSARTSNVQRILELINEFGVHQKYLMNVGEAKGQIVTSLISKHKPAIMLEFGSYIGYSTLLFAASLAEHNAHAQYISFERSAKFARIAQNLVDLAGLSDIVRFVVGSSSQGLIDEHEAGRLTHADMIFLDHYKPAYVKDVKICESLGIIREGTVLAADNVITPGNPTYLAYVRSSPEEKQQKLRSGKDEHQSASAQFPERTANQYKDYQDDGLDRPGVPEIVYTSRLEHSHEPTGEPDGVEVTICEKRP